MILNKYSRSMVPSYTAMSSWIQMVAAVVLALSSLKMPRRQRKLFKLPLAWRLTDAKLEWTTCCHKENVLGEQNVLPITGHPVIAFTLATCRGKWMNTTLGTLSKNTVLCQTQG